jgi:hypothetical protein
MPESQTRSASPQVVKRDSDRSDSSQESNEALVVYDVTKHKLRLWKDEPLKGRPRPLSSLIFSSDVKTTLGAKFCQLRIPRWRNHMRIPLSEVDSKEGVKTGVVNLDRLGHEFNLRRRFMPEHKMLYVLYGEKNEQDMWDITAGTRCESPVANTSDK